MSLEPDAPQVGSLDSFTEAGIEADGEEDGREFWWCVVGTTFAAAEVAQIVADVAAWEVLTIAVAYL